MKRLIYLVVLVSFTSCSDEENSITTTTPTDPETEIQKGKIIKEIDVNGIKRDYIVHVPQSYSADEKYPLLFAFHGLGGNMKSSYDNSKFHLLAESENFIVVHPNGISSKWNAVTVSNNADIDFVNVLIAELQKTYAVDSNRIYSSGMSNGGYFSFLLACELSDKIAAIGSVTGLMFKNALENCSPKRSVPILQIHGTQDNVVNYSGVDEVISYWVEHNGLNSTPIKSQIPDSDTTDGSTVEKFVYQGDNENVEIQHFKIIGGSHEWPGYQGNMDIDASTEVWNFVKKYDINGRIN